ncbi:MAG: M23 family metallopeptidase [Treponema sp.]|nr:M23 family metallopeptidase [Treponema sp.]
MKIPKISILIILLNLIILLPATAQSGNVRYAVVPENPAPGEPVTIGVSGGVKQAVLTVNGRALARTAFFYVPAGDEKLTFMAAILTIPNTLNATSAEIRLENENVTMAVIPITISRREFDNEILRLDQALTDIRTDTSPQRTEESNRLWDVLSATGNYVYHTGRFIAPVQATRRTSSFAERRIYIYSDGGRGTSIHTGLDYGIPTGTEVVSCGNGKVVLASSMIVAGNAIIIEHAPGIYSLYYHLDKIEVKEGDFVNAGTRIGLSGATGLATGPHLHWDIRINTETTDPDFYLARPIIDKELIISKIYNTGD